MENKKNILFVGSFSHISKYEHKGGLMFACDTIYQSLKEDNNWILIDSTASTNKHRGGLERLRYALIRMGKLLKYLSFKKVDIVVLFHVQGFSFVEKGIMALFSKLFGKKVVISPRSGLLLDNLETSAFYRFWTKLIFSITDKVFCQSEYWKRYFLDLVGNNPSTYSVIHNWIDSDNYFENKPLPKETKKQCLNILFLGWITPNKGIFDLVAAANRLKNRDIKFLIAGDGDAFDEVVTEVKKLQLDYMFDFKGWIKGADKMALFKEIDIFVLASYREGYPNALLENMASCTAVIATNIGSVPDLIQDKENGYLYEPGDVDALVQNLECLISDESERKRIALNGKRRIANNNTIAIGSDKFRQLLKTLH